MNISFLKNGRSKFKKNKTSDGQLRNSLNSVKMSGITKRKKGQMLRNTERQLILNLMNYLKSKNSQKSISEIIREISKSTGCSERTIYKIKKEASKGITAVTRKKRSRKKENKNSRDVKYDSFVKSSIRKKIHNYFLQNCSPTLNKILCLVNSDPDLPNFKRSTLHTLLKEIGFVYERKGKKCLLTESRDLVKLRQTYLKVVRQFRNENRWIVYTGETVLSLLNKDIEKNKNYLTVEQKSKKIQTECESVKVVINASEPLSGAALVYTIDAAALNNIVMGEGLELREGISVIQENYTNADNIPVDKVIAQENATGIQVKTDSTGDNKEPSRELRLTIMHAGSDQGFIQGVDFITLSKKKAEDVENYKHWFLEILLPKIPPNSVVVTDINAPHHKIKENFPDGSWKKQEIKDWLLSKNLKVDHLSQKKDLLSIVNQVRPIYSTNYKIGEIAKEKGIAIVSLPPFHYELNPLNMVWAQIKYYVKSNIKSFKTKKIKHLIRESFYSATQLNWMNYFQHVRETEDLLWTIDKHTEQLQHSAQQSITSEKISDSINHL